MNIWVVGAGSIGMLLAAKLALAGQAVRVVTHSEEQARAIMDEGLRLVEGDNEYVARPEAIAFRQLKRLASAAVQSPDWLLLTVKQQHLTDELMTVLGKWCARGTRLLAWQNGIGHVERLADYIPASRLDTAVTTEGARKNSLNEIHHTGFGMTRIGCAIEPGEAEERQGAEQRQKKLIAALHMAGFEVSLSNNMREIAWNKLLVNAVINPLTALLQVPNGRLLELEPLMPLMRSLYEEGVEAAHAENVRLQEDLWEQVLEVCRRTANNASSMLQDVTVGRPTEIDWVNGALLQVARKHGLTLMANSTMYRLIKSIEAKQRQSGE